MTRFFDFTFNSEIAGLVIIDAYVEYTVSWQRRDYEINHREIRVIDGQGLCSKSCLTLDDWEKLNDAIEVEFERLDPIEEAELAIAEVYVDAEMEAV